MKKLYIVFAIVLANGVFVSCTELDDNLDNEPTQFEASATGGEDGQDPDYDDDENIGGGN